YPVDNLEGNFTRAFQDNILQYQTDNDLAQIPQITPEWFIVLEHDAIASLLTEIEKTQPSLSEAELQTALLNSITERLPNSVTLNTVNNSENNLNATQNKLLYTIESQAANQSAYDTVLAIDFLKQTPDKDSTIEFPNTLEIYFDASSEDIQKITGNPRSQKTLTLQTWLRIAGYFPPPLVIDGMNGANSRNAIKRYQTSIGQPADGIPHVRWEEPLETLIRTKAQQQLKNLELYSRSINGKNDAATRNAIRRFEKSVGLPETGTLAPSVLFHLFNPKFLPENAGNHIAPIQITTVQNSATSPKGAATATTEI